MKKIITILALLFALNINAQSYNPIATHDFGIDSITQLDKQLRVWQINIDVKANSVVVVYDIVLVSNNVIVSVLNTSTYVRDNNTSSLNFNSLRSSVLGQQMAYMISQDIGKIQSFQTLTTDLQQK